MRQMERIFKRGMHDFGTRGMAGTGEVSVTVPATGAVVRLTLHVRKRALTNTQRGRLSVADLMAVA
jgi:hypothetical protein